MAITKSDIGRAICVSTNREIRLSGNEIVRELRELSERKVLGDLVKDDDPSLARLDGSIDKLSVLCEENLVTLVSDGCELPVLDKVTRVLGRLVKIRSELEKTKLMKTGYPLEVLKSLGGTAGTTILQQNNDVKVNDKSLMRDVLDCGGGDVDDDE